MFYDQLHLVLHASPPPHPPLYLSTLHHHAPAPFGVITCATDMSERCASCSPKNNALLLLHMWWLPLLPAFISYCVVVLVAVPKNMEVSQPKWAVINTGLTFHSVHCCTATWTERVHQIIMSNGALPEQTHTLLLHDIFSLNIFIFPLHLVWASCRVEVNKHLISTRTGIKFIILVCVYSSSICAWIYTPCCVTLPAIWICWSLSDWQWSKQLQWMISVSTCIANWETIPFIWGLYVSTCKNAV